MPLLTSLSVFGSHLKATTSSGAINHPYPHDAYWSNDEVLVNHVSILYTGQHSNTVASGVAVFYDGLYSVQTYDATNPDHAAGVVNIYYTYTHPHQFGIYWTDTSPLANGDLLYVAEHTIEVAASYSGDLGNGPLTTDESGIVSYTYNYPYQYGSYWSDASSLANGSVLYVGEHNATTADNVAQFTEGDYYVNTDESGVVTLTYAVTHSYQHDAYWSDDEVLVSGSVLYVGQHNNTTANNVTQFTEGVYYVNTNGSGVVTLTYVINHPYQHDAYWSDDEVLVSGSVLYVGEHNATTANNVAQFTEGDSYVNTNSSGVVTLSYDVTHSYQHSSYWSDASSLANGSVLYVGQHNNTTANNVTQFTEGDYYVNTDESGVVTLTYVINHPYQHDAYWSDDEVLVSGSVLYVGQHNNTTANNVTQFTEGDSYVNTNSSGVVTLTYAVTHSYQHGDYWSDSSSLANGSVLYTSQHNNTIANYITQFIQGEYYVNTDGNGIVTLTYVINHLYSHGSYWSDDEVLVNGSVLYTGQHNNTTAANNVSFEENGYMVYVGTNFDGVVYLNAINNEYQYGAYWSNVSSINTNGSIVMYTGPNTFTRASSVSFEYDGYMYYTDGVGVITSSQIINHPYSHDSYWSDDVTLANGSVLYTGQHTNATANNVTQFTEGLNYVDTNGSGVVTLSYIYNHPHTHNSYYSNDATLANGSVLYTGQHNATTANNVSFTEGASPNVHYISTDGSGAVTITYGWEGQVSCKNNAPITLYTTSSTLGIDVILYTDSNCQYPYSVNFTFLPQNSNIKWKTNGSIGIINGFEICDGYAS